MESTFGRALLVATHAMVIVASAAVTPLVALAFAAGIPLKLLIWSIPCPQIGFAWTFVAVLPTVYLGVFAILATIDSRTELIRCLQWIASSVEALAVSAVLLLQLFLDALAGGGKNQIYVLLGFSYPAAAYLAYSALVSSPDRPAWLRRWWPRFLAGAVPTVLTAVLAAFIAWDTRWK